MSLLTWKLGLEIFHLHQFSDLQWISTQLQREGRVAFILLGSLMSSAMEFASSCFQAFNSEQMFLLFVKKLLILLLPEPSLWCYSQKWKWRCLISLWAIAKLWSQGNKQCAGEMGLSSYRTATSRILFIFLPIQCCSPDSLRFPLKLHAIPNSLPRVQAHSLMLAERLSEWRRSSLLDWAPEQVWDGEGLMSNCCLLGCRALYLPCMGFTNWNEESDPFISFPPLCTSRCVPCVASHAWPPQNIACPFEVSKVGWHGWQQSLVQWGLFPMYQCSTMNSNLLHDAPVPPHPPSLCPWLLSALNCLFINEKGT